MHLKRPCTSKRPVFPFRRNHPAAPTHLMARLPAGPKEPQNLQSMLRSPQGTKVAPAHPGAKRNSARSTPPRRPARPLSAPYLTCGFCDARLEHEPTIGGHLPAPRPLGPANPPRGSLRPLSAAEPRRSPSPGRPPGGWCDPHRGAAGGMLLCPAIPGVTRQRRRLGTPRRPVVQPGFPATRGD